MFCHVNGSIPIPVTIHLDTFFAEFLDLLKRQIRTFVNKRQIRTFDTQIYRDQHENKRGSQHWPKES